MLHVSDDLMVLAHPLNVISYYYKNVYLFPKYYELDEIYVIVYLYIYRYTEKM